MAAFSSLKTELTKLALWFARLPILRQVVVKLFKYMNPFSTHEKLYENDFWIVIHHPQPAYALHLLLIPKRGCESFMAAPEDDPNLYQSLFNAVRHMINHYHLDATRYRLIMNGGANQTFPQWHYHLISSQPPTESPHA
jgi:diadenosine tetraphosphate (Ap4A) HIT family hydrolase